MGIDTENQEIEKSIREIAKKLLSENQVDVIIGYSEGTIPLSSTPIFIRNEEDVNKLVWNNLCYINLANYLVPLMPQLCDAEGNSLKIGIVAKGCVGRAVNHLAVEKQVDLENVKMIGIRCNGIVNIGYRPEDTQSIESGLISVAEFYRLVLAGAGSGRYRRPASGTTIQPDLNLQCRVAPGVEDFSGFDMRNS